MDTTAAVARIVNFVNDRMGDYLFTLYTDDRGDPTVTAVENNELTNRVFAAIHRIAGYSVVTAFDDGGAYCGGCDRWIWDDHYRLTYAVINGEIVCGDCMGSDPNEYIFADGHESGSTSGFMWANNSDSSGVWFASVAVMIGHGWEEIPDHYYVMRPESDRAFSDLIASDDTGIFIRVNSGSHETFMRCVDDDLIEYHGTSRHR